VFKSRYDFEVPGHTMEDQDSTSGRDIGSARTSVFRSDGTCFKSRTGVCLHTYVLSGVSVQAK
jgi:hypothetical protein